MGKPWVFPFLFVQKVYIMLEYTQEKDSSKDKGLTK